MCMSNTDSETEKAYPARNTDNKSGPLFSGQVYIT